MVWRRAHLPQVQLRAQGERSWLGHPGVVCDNREGMRMKTETLLNPKPKYWTWNWCVSRKGVGWVASAISRRRIGWFTMDMLVW